MPSATASDALLDSAPDAVISMDEQGRVVSLNGTAERIFGLDAAAVAGRTASELLFPPLSRALHSAELDRVLRGAAAGPGERLQIPVVGGDGREILAEIAVTRTSETPPRFAAWLRALPDPSDALEEAQRRQALLEAAEELAGVGSWQWIPAREELQWSDNLFRIFGLGPGEIVPTPEYVFAQTHPDDRDRVTRIVGELGEGGRLHPLDYRIVRPDGVVRHLRATLAVAEERGGVPYRLVGSVQDLTDRRRAEREIAAHFAVTEALLEWPSLERGGERLLANLAEAMDFTAGILWVPRGDVLIARVLWHAPSAPLPEFERVSRQARIPRGVGLPGRVWERGEPINLTALGDGMIRPRREAALREGLREAVALPAIAAEEVLAVVELVSREEAELTPRLMRSLTGIGYELGQFLARRRADLEAPLLTVREREVLQFAAQGLSARQTAERLIVSPATVRTHLEHIYAKLGVSDKASAVARALRDGLIE